MKTNRIVLLPFLILFLISPLKSFSEEKVDKNNIDTSIVDEALDSIESVIETKRKSAEPEKAYVLPAPSRENKAVNEEIDMPEDVIDEMPLSEPEKNSPELPEVEETNDEKINKDEVINKKEIIIDKFQVNQMDIKDALGLLSLKTGLEIIFDKNIKGLVTVSLENVRAIDVLRIILDMSNLAYNEIGDKIHIMTVEEFENKIGHGYEQELETRIIPLMYIKTTDILEPLMKLKGPLGKVIPNEDSNGFILIDTSSNIEVMAGFIKDMDISLEKEVFTLSNAYAKEILEKIENIITKDKGSFTYDEKLNRLEVTDTFLKVKEIEKLINEYSNTNKQIDLKVKVLQIVLSEEHIQGVDWEAIISDYKGIPFPSFINKNENQSLSIGTISEEDYKILVDALDTVGDINTVMNFNEKLVNQKQSKIGINLNVNKITDNKNESSREESSSLQLLLNPMIIKDGISIDIKPWLKESGIKSDLITLKIDNGSTVVLGSIFKEVKIKQIGGVPFLRELPIIKIAFRRTRQSTQKIEFVVFLTLQIAGK